MPQHFLLSSEARALFVRKVMELTNDQAFEIFKEVRWCNGEEVACPVCGTIGKQWRCKDFNHTQRHVWHHLRLPQVAVARVPRGYRPIFTNAVKGISALQLARDLGAQYKTAFVLAHKIRESLMEQRELEKLDGGVHMDGAYVNGHIRPKNKKSERIDRRLAAPSNNYFHSLS